MYIYNAWDKVTEKSLKAIDHNQNIDFLNLSRSQK